jgi:signal transduction histidine kinase
VIEVATDVDREVSPEYAELLRGRHLVCTPMAAAGRWVGVVLSDRSPASPPLSDDDRHVLWTLGKTTALAAVARISTRQSVEARELRQRIDMARDIHAGVIQRLFGVSLALSAGEHGEPVPEDTLARCAEEVQVAMADLRNALQRPLGRQTRPTETTLVEELRRLAAEHPDLVLEPGSDEHVPPSLEPLAQSVLVEAVRNAYKHARPTQVGVRVLNGDGAFVLEVSNDGVHGRSRQTGMGLRLAAFEALQFGGVIEFGARGENMWQVRLMVPHEA